MGSVLRSLSAVRTFVTDLEQARRFYGGIFELEEQASGPGYIVYKVSDAQVVVEALAPDDPEAGDLVGRFLAVSFDCRDEIHATYQRLRERGVAFDEPPEKQFWGGTLAFPRDPDGNVLTLVG